MLRLHGPDVWLRTANYMSAHVIADCRVRRFEELHLIPYAADRAAVFAEQAKNIRNPHLSAVLPHD